MVDYTKESKEYGAIKAGIETSNPNLPYREVVSRAKAIQQRRRLAKLTPAQRRQRLKNTVDMLKK